MYRTRIRKILGDVRSRLGRTILVSIAIFIGVTGTIALFSMSNILVAQLEEDIKEEDLSMLDIFMTVTDEVDLDDQGYVDRISEVDGVTDVLGAASLTVYFKADPTDEDFEEAGLTGFLSPFEELSIVPMRLLEGNYPTEGADELVVETQFADKYDLAVGDTVTMRVLGASRNPELAGEISTSEEWTISGIVFHSYAGGSSGPI